MNRNRAVAQRVAANVRSEMARQRKKGTDAAAMLGVSQSSMSRRVAGDQPYSLDELEALAQWLDVPITALFAAPTYSGGGASRKPAGYGSATRRTRFLGNNAVTLSGSNPRVNETHASRVTRAANSEAA